MVKATLALLVGILDSFVHMNALNYSNYGCTFEDEKRTLLLWNVHHAWKVQQMQRASKQRSCHIRTFWFSKLLSMFAICILVESLRYSRISCWFGLNEDKAKVPTIVLCYLAFGGTSYK